MKLTALVCCMAAALAVPRAAAVSVNAHVQASSGNLRDAVMDAQGNVMEVDAAVASETETGKVEAHAHTGDLIFKCHQGNEGMCTHKQAVGASCGTGSTFSVGGIGGGTGVCMTHRAVLNGMKMDNVFKTTKEEGYLYGENTVKWVECWCRSITTNNYLQEGLAYFSGETTLETLGMA